MLVVFTDDNKMKVLRRSPRIAALRLRRSSRSANKLRLLMPVHLSRTAPARAIPARTVYTQTHTKKALPTLFVDVPEWWKTYKDSFQDFASYSYPRWPHIQMILEFIVPVLENGMLTTDVRRVIGAIPHKTVHGKDWNFELRSFVPDGGCSTAPVVLNIRIVSIDLLM